MSANHQRELPHCFSRDSNHEDVSLSFDPFVVHRLVINIIPLTLLLATTDGGKSGGCLLRTKKTRVGSAFTILIIFIDQ